MTASSSSSSSSSTAATATLQRAEELSQLIFHRDALRGQLTAMTTPSLIIAATTRIMTATNRSVMDPLHDRHSEWIPLHLDSDRRDADGNPSGAIICGNATTHYLVGMTGICIAATTLFVMYWALIGIYVQNQSMHDGFANGINLECRSLWNAAKDNLIIISLVPLIPCLLCCVLCARFFARWFDENSPQVNHFIISGVILGITFIGINIASLIWMITDSSHTYATDDGTGTITYTTKKCRDTSYSLWAMDLALIIVAMFGGLCGTIFAYEEMQRRRWQFTCLYSRQRHQNYHNEQVAASGTDEEVRGSKQIDHTLTANRLLGVGGHIERIVCMNIAGHTKQATHAAVIVAAIKGELPDGYEIDFDGQPRGGQWISSLRTTHDRRYGHHSYDVMVSPSLPSMLSRVQQTLAGAPVKPNRSATIAATRLARLSTTINNITANERPTSSGSGSSSGGGGGGGGGCGMIARVSDDIWRTVFTMLRPCHVLQSITALRSWRRLIRDDKMWHIWWHQHMNNLAVPSSLTPSHLRALVVMLTMGDGTVRLRSMTIPFLPLIDIVSITIPDDDEANIGTADARSLVMTGGGARDKTHKRQRQRRSLRHLAHNIVAINDLLYIISCDTFEPLSLSLSSSSASSNRLSLTTSTKWLQSFGSAAAFPQNSGALATTTRWHICLNDGAKLDDRGASHHVIGVDPHLSVVLDGDTATTHHAVEDDVKIDVIDIETAAANNNSSAMMDPNIFNHIRLHASGSSSGNSSMEVKTRPTTAVAAMPISPTTLPPTSSLIRRQVAAQTRQLVISSSPSQSSSYFAANLADKRTFASNMIDVTFADDTIVTMSELHEHVIDRIWWHPDTNNSRNISRSNYNRNGSLSSSSSSSLSVLVSSLSMLRQRLYGSVCYTPWHMSQLELLTTLHHHLAARYHYEPA